MDKQFKNLLPAFIQQYILDGKISEAQQIALLSMLKLTTEERKRKFNLFSTPSDIYRNVKISSLISNEAIMILALDLMTFEQINENRIFLLISERLIT